MTDTLMIRCVIWFCVCVNYSFAQLTRNHDEKVHRSNDNSAIHLLPNRHDIVMKAVRKQHLTIAYANLHYISNGLKACQQV